jgi:hypothetical protein
MSLIGRNEEVLVLVLNTVCTLVLRAVEIVDQVTGTTEIENKVGPTIVVVGVTTEVMNVGTVWI